MNLTEIEIPPEIAYKWQEIVNLLAEIAQVPAALIKKIEPPEIVVFVSSESGGNPYKRAYRASLETDLYGETVIKTHQPLLTPDALADEVWRSTSDFKLGMRSYLGFPLNWPNGDIFGTICILDNKPNAYSELHQRLLRQFRHVVEADLKLLFERQQAEAALAEERNLLRTLIENLPDYIYVKDTESRFVLANMALTRQLGATAPDEVIGKTDFDFFPPELARQYRADEQVIFQSGQPLISHEELFVDPLTGQILWMSTTKVPLRDNQGRIVGLVGMNREITERKQADERLRESEEKFRSLYTNTPAMMHSIDPDGRLMSVSNYWLESLGYERAEVIGRKSVEFLTPASQKYAQEVVLPEFFRLGMCKNVPYQFIKKNGEIMDVLLSAIAEKDAAGNVARSLAVLVDVTDRKRAEEALRQEKVEREILISELEAKNAELERFIYSVSHDLKSPLITIRGFLGFVERAALAGNIAQMQADIARIVKATDKMQQLLDELLELSRIGRLINLPETAPLGQLAAEAVEMVAGRLTERGVEVTIAPDLPLVYGDRSRLRELLENLLDNAVKYMGHQPHPRVEIGVRRNHAEPIFYVRDNGMGIDPRYHQKVFGLFEKLDQQAEGTGVGLAIVKRIVEVHGGRIWIESDGVGQGSTFCFTLPPPASNA